MQIATAQSAEDLSGTTSYDGFVGLECFPAGDSDEALRAFISTYGEN